MEDLEPTDEEVAAELEAHNQRYDVDTYMREHSYDSNGKLHSPSLLHSIRQAYYMEQSWRIESRRIEQSNLWSSPVTEAFFNRLCAAGTLHRQVHNTPNKKFSFLATRIGLTDTQLKMVNPLEYEKRHMWGWTVPLTPEQRSELKA